MHRQNHWLEFPYIVAPSPFDRAKTVNLSISNEYIEKHAYIKKRTPIFAIWTHLVGKEPPVNNIEREFLKKPPPTLTLLEAEACFLGVNRPYHDDDNGSEVAVFILKPTHTLKYEPDLVCVALTCASPIGTVLTAQVRFDTACQDSENQIDGMVTRLEFVPSDPGNLSLPRGFKTRYTKRLW